MEMNDWLLQQYILEQSQIFGNHEGLICPLWANEWKKTSPNYAVAKYSGKLAKMNSGY